jgi:DNA-binding XRE family transcriptional regulator
MTPGALPPGAGNIAGVLAQILVTLRSIENLLRAQHVPRPEPASRVVGMPNLGPALPPIAAAPAERAVERTAPAQTPVSLTNRAARRSRSVGRPSMAVHPAGPATGRRMRELRARLGVSQRELGAQLGVSGAMVAVIETGRAGISQRVDEAMRRIGVAGG